LFDTAAAEENAGWKKRKQMTTLVNGLQLIGPLHSEHINQERYLLNDLEVFLRSLLYTRRLFTLAKGEGSKK